MSLRVDGEKVEQDTDRESSSVPSTLAMITAALWRLCGRFKWQIVVIVTVLVTLVVISLPGGSTSISPFGLTIDGKKDIIGGFQFVDENGALFGNKQVANKLRTSSKPFSWDIAGGDMATHTPFRRFGHNDDVAATWETIRHSSEVLTYLTSAEILHVVSDSVADATGSTGAREIYISGLDGSYDCATETLAISGTNVVSTVNSYIRVFHAYTREVGSGGVNAGAISITNNTEDNELLLLVAGEGSAHSAVFTIPNDKVGFVVSWEASEVKGKETEVGLWIRKFGESWRLHRMKYTKDNLFCVHLDLPFKFPAKTDIEIRAKAADGSGKVSGGFEGWYEAE